MGKEKKWVTFAQSNESLHQKSPLQKGGFEYRIKSKKPFVKTVYFESFRAYQERNKK